MKRLIMRKLVVALCTSGMFGISTQAMASAFQLWEQDVASIGNYHAGYAAEANDASTAWYNPAGIPRIQNQQLVLGAAAILSDFKYRGTIQVSGLGRTLYPVTAQGGNFGLIPNLHYVAPITERIGLGLSIDAPFGLKTSYGSSTFLRYAATLTSITVIDISPSLGFQITDKASLGAGFDVQKAYGEFDSVGAFASPINDTTSTNKANDTGYGYHLGALYQLTPDIRVGASYHSQVVHHLTGSSKFVGPIATLFTDGPLSSSRARTNITLPPYTAFTIYDKFRPCFAAKASVIYTQWNTFRTLTINNVAGLAITGTGLAPSTTIQAVIPEKYRNTWNFALGSDYFVTDGIIIRSGIGYDETPVRKTYRNVQLPDNNRFVIALGSHFQASKAIGFDLGWSHVFIDPASVNPPPLSIGAQTVVTNGTVNGGADVFGAQLVWDIV